MANTYQKCRDVASGTDRHLDIGLQVVEVHPLFPYFLEKRSAIPTSPFFILKLGENPSEEVDDYDNYYYE